MKLYIQNLKNCLAELADIDFQRRVWLSESKSEVSSFSELKAQLFDDTGLSDVIDDLWLDSYFGKEIADKFRKLDKLISTINEFTEPSVLIEQTEMQQIRNLAKEILIAIEAKN